MADTKKLEWEYKGKRKKVGSYFKEQICGILLQAFSTTKYCQISGAEDDGASTKRQFEQMYLSFFLYISKQGCFEKVSVGKGFLTLCFQCWEEFFSSIL